MISEHEWLPTYPFLTKVKLIPFIPKTADVDKWLKNFDKARRREKNPEKKHKMNVIFDEIGSIKDML